jgi:urease accessory protein
MSSFASDDVSLDLPRPQLDLCFARRGSVTVLDRRRFRWPFVLTRTFALDAQPRHMLTVIVQTGAGALHGGDRLAQHIVVEEGAAAHVTTPGASCVYRAGPGLESRDHVTLNVARDGYLEYLPEPRILFPDAALEQSLEIECSPGGVALVSDAFTVHDPTGCGRGFRRLRSSTILRCLGELALTERSDIDDLGMGSATGFTAFASLMLAAPGRLGDCTALAEELTRTFASTESLYGAASLLPGDVGVGVRLAARELRDVRDGTAAVWRATRCAFYGTPPESRRKEAG